MMKLLNCSSFISVVLKIKTEHESKVSYLAHYTSIAKLHQLLADDAKFRLYSAANMNDPNEGRTLIKEVPELKKFYDKKDDYAFIASFVEGENIEKGNTKEGNLKESDNALLLWRSYGRDTKGAKFINSEKVFNTEHLESSVDVSSLLQKQQETKATSQKQAEQTDIEKTAAHL